MGLLIIVLIIVLVIAAVVWAIIMQNDRYAYDRAMDRFEVVVGRVPFDYFRTRFTEDLSGEECDKLFDAASVAHADLRELKTSLRDAASEIKLSRNLRSKVKARGHEVDDLMRICHIMMDRVRVDSYSDFTGWRIFIQSVGWYELADTNGYLQTFLEFGRYMCRAVASLVDEVAVSGDGSRVRELANSLKTRDYSNRMRLSIPIDTTSLGVSFFQELSAPTSDEHQRFTEGKSALSVTDRLWREWFSKETNEEVPVEA